jgi:hypothetical protein
VDSADDRVTGVTATPPALEASDYRRVEAGRARAHALLGVRGDVLSGVGAHAGVTPGFNVAVFIRDNRDNRSNRSRKRGKLAEQRNSGTAEQRNTQHATRNAKPTISTR